MVNIEFNTQRGPWVKAFALLYFDLYELGIDPEKFESVLVWSENYSSSTIRPEKENHITVRRQVRRALFEGQTENSINTVDHKIKIPLYWRFLGITGTEAVFLVKKEPSIDEGLSVKQTLKNISKAVGSNMMGEMSRDHRLHPDQEMLEQLGLTI